MALNSTDLQRLPRNKRGRILIAQNVTKPGDELTIDDATFLAVFANAASLGHAELSAALGPGSGWHQHLDNWKSKGIIT